MKLTKDAARRPATTCLAAGLIAAALMLPTAPMSAAAADASSAGNGTNQGTQAATPAQDQGQSGAGAESKDKAADAGAPQSGEAPSTATDEAAAPSPDQGQSGAGAAGQTTAPALDTIALASNAILRQAALDSRVADNKITPIAVTDGNNIYGARQTPEPFTANLAAIPGSSYFVDCAATVNGSGTQTSPFNSLDAINAVTLKPGDAALFKGGSHCTGTFTPKGSGTAEKPIRIDAYDASESNRARIDGAGATDAVLLSNVEHYVVRNLELTNKAGNDQDYTAVTHGLRVELHDFGTGTGYDVANLYVHDVLGKNDKAAAGIRFEVNGTTTKTKFSGVQIAYNTLRHVNRTGIVVATSWWQKEEAEYWGGQFYAMDPVHFHDNFLTDIGGDGIVVWAAPKSVLEYNTLENAANTHNGKSDNLHNAGIWAWVADDVVFRNNHIFNIHRANNNNDGAAFDADTGGTGQVFEHNLTHDNDGGFMMYCGCWGLSTNITVRYNITMNDGRFVQMIEKFKDSGNTARTVFMAGATDSHFYNNTVLLPPTQVNIASYGHYMGNNVVVANNLFIAQPGTVVKDDTTGVEPNTLSWRNNVFAGPADGAWPSGQRASGNQVVPTLSLVEGNRGLAQFHIQDKALKATGYPVADPYQAGNVYDFLGNPVPTVTNPDVGAFQFSTVPQQVTVSDGGFETPDVAAWKLSDAEVTPQPRSGKEALRVDAGGSATTTVKAAINRTYRLVAAVKATEVAQSDQAGAAGDAVTADLASEADTASEAGEAVKSDQTGEAGALPVVTVTLPSGASVQAQPQVDAKGQPVLDKDGWAHVETVFRTSWDASTFAISVAAKDGGLVDDVSAEGVLDHMIDGSFEAPANTVWQPPVQMQGTPGNSGESGPLERSTDAVSGTYAAPVPATGKRADAAMQPEDFTGDAFSRFTYVMPGQEYQLGVWAKASDGKNVSLEWENYPGWSPDYALTLQHVLGSVSTTSNTYTRIALNLKPEQSQIVVACSGNGLCDDMTLVQAWDGSVPSVEAPQAEGAGEQPTPGSSEASDTSEEPGDQDGTAAGAPGAENAATEGKGTHADAHDSDGKGAEAGGKADVSGAGTSGQTPTLSATGFDAGVLTLAGLALGAGLVLSAARVHRRK